MSAGGAQDGTPFIPTGLDSIILDVKDDEALSVALRRFVALLERARPNVVSTAYAEEKSSGLKIVVTLQHREEPDLRLNIRFENYHYETAVISAALGWRGQRPAGVCGGTAEYPIDDDDEVDYYWDAAFETLEALLTQPLELAVTFLANQVASIRVKTSMHAKTREIGARRNLWSMKVFSRWHREEIHRVSFL